MYSRCRYCGDGFVTIYGLPCTKCRIMASAFREKNRPKTDLAAWAWTVCILVAAGALTVSWFKPGWFQ
jgi:hypothetical protein